MPQANQLVTTIPSATRRNIFAGAAAAASIAGLLRASASPNKDAGLLALVSEFRQRDEAATTSFFANMEEVEALGLAKAEDHARKCATVAACQAETERLDVLLLRISETPAQTASGLAAKASILRRWMGDGWDATRHHYQNPWERLAYSLADDLIDGRA